MSGTATHVVANFYRGLSTAERIKRSIEENICGWCGYSMRDDPYPQRMRERLDDGTFSSFYPVCFLHFCTGGSATKRIAELFEELKQKYGRGGGTNFSDLEVLAIKQYLDELADGRPVSPLPFVDYMIPVGRPETNEERDLRLRQKGEVSNLRSTGESI